MSSEVVHDAHFYAAVAFFLAAAFLFGIVIVCEFVFPERDDKRDIY